MIIPMFDKFSAVSTAVRMEAFLKVRLSRTRLPPPALVTGVWRL